jgi:hypothetical protein
MYLHITRTVLFACTYGLSQLVEELGHYEERGLVEGDRPYSLQWHVLSDGSHPEQVMYFDWRTNASCAS